MNRVVITGMGIYSTIGLTLEEVRDSLYHGRSGIGIDEERIRYGFISPLTGLIKRPDLKGALPRRMRIGMAEQAEYAYMATIDALKQSHIDEDYLNKNIIGILYGNDSSATPVVEAADIIRQKKDTTLIGSGNIFQAMNGSRRPLNAIGDIEQPFPVLFRSGQRLHRMHGCDQFVMRKSCR